MKKNISGYLPFLFALLVCQCALSQQFCRTPDRRNFTSTKEIAAAPNLKWRFKTNGAVYASPVLYNNIIITGSCDSNLYAINNSDGKLLWEFKTGGEIRSSVAIENNTAFFISTDGILYAIDVQSGKQKWTFETGGEKFYDAWDYYQSSPTLNNGVIYFGCGDSHIYALDAASGKLNWKYKTGGIVHASPTIAGNAVLIGSFDGYFYCINPNGTLRWKFDTIGEHYFPLGEVQFHATVDDSAVFFCSRDYNVYALKIKDGGGHWVYHEPGSWTSAPSLADKRLIVTMSDAHKILGFGKTYGVKLYETAVPLNVFCSASLNDSMAYFGGMDGIIYKMDIISGKSTVLFQTESSKKYYADFIDPAGKLREDIIQKYSNDATPLYTEFLKMGSIFSTPWIDNGVLYFGSVDGYIYAIG